MSISLMDLRFRFIQKTARHDTERMPEALWLFEKVLRLTFFVIQRSPASNQGYKMTQMLENQSESPDEIERKRILNEIKEEISRIRNYTPKVAIFGDTGVGKSSLCNALFGKKIAEISDVEACTRAPQEILLSGDEHGIRLIDVLGVGEDPRRHAEYRELYKSLLPGLDLVIWAIKADDRKYSTSIEVYQEILRPNLEKCPVVFVITQTDKIEPHRKWNEQENKPGDEQFANLNIKI